MKTKHYLLLGLAALGGLALWGKLSAEKEKNMNVKFQVGGKDVSVSLLPNGTILTKGVGDILPPNPMELAWDYPSLVTSHAPGRIYKV